MVKWSGVNQLAKMLYIYIYIYRLGIPLKSKLSIFSVPGLLTDYGQNNQVSANRYQHIT